MPSGMPPPPPPPLLLLQAPKENGSAAAAANRNRREKAMCRSSGEFGVAVLSRTPCSAQYAETDRRCRDLGHTRRDAQIGACGGRPGHRRRRVVVVATSLTSDGARGTGRPRQGGGAARPDRPPPGRRPGGAR